MSDDLQAECDHKDSYGSLFMGERCMICGAKEPERPKKCLHHTDGNGPDEYFVHPFTPCASVRCQCPGDCPGLLELEQLNLDADHAFLVCDICNCGYIVKVAGK